MSQTAAIFPRRLPPVARSEQRTLLRPVPPVDELLAEAPFDEDTRGWLEAHLDKLLAFVGSAALSAALISRLLPAGPPHAPVTVRTAPIVAQAAPVKVVVPAVPIATAPVAVEVAMPPSEAPAAAVPAVAAPPVAQATPRAVKHAAKRIAHAKHKARAHLRRAARVAPRSATPADASLGPAAAALIAQGTDALRRHDEAQAIHDFESAQAASGHKLPAAVRQKLGLLHVAAALRDRRAGNEAGARMEFQAAHRADPSNARAASEVAASTDEVELQDAIDPD